MPIGRPFASLFTRMGFEIFGQGECGNQAEFLILE
jgi:hypothetical protein